MSTLGVVFVWGVSNSGKTTLIERLLPLFRARGLRVGSVKHAHEGFEIDRPGKDSWRHAQAGANPVALVGPRQAAWIIQAGEEPALEEVVELMRDRVDLVLVEGFKPVGWPDPSLDDAASPCGGGRTVGAWCGAAGRRHRPVGVLLEWRNGPRLSFEGMRCRVGPPPMELTASELEQIAESCVREAGGQAPRGAGQEAR